MKVHKGRQDQRDRPVHRGQQDPQGRPEPLVLKARSDRRVLKAKLAPGPPKAIQDCPRSDVAIRAAAAAAKSKFRQDIGFSIMMHDPAGCNALQ